MTGVRRPNSCSACGAVGVTIATHRDDGTHRAPRSTQRRTPGCRHCGSREHTTKCHYGRTWRRDIVRLTPKTRQRRGLRPDPLGIARSSWLIQREVMS